MTTVNGSDNNLHPSNSERHKSPSLNMNPVLSPMVTSPISGSNQNGSLDPISSQNHCETETVLPANNSDSSSSSSLLPNVKTRMGRARSNSRSEGSQYQNDFDQLNTTYNMIQTFNNNSNCNSNITENTTTTTNITGTTQNIRKRNHKNKIKDTIKDNKSDTNHIKDDNNGKNNVPPSILTSRNKYTYIIILKSLNNTFETKFLMVPFKPDILKLGRPVVNNNNGNNNNDSSSNNNHNNNNNSNRINGHNITNDGNDLLKRSTSGLVRPDNGNFDSRVLSRNHASLTCDPRTGKIYIKDLKSSNGTFINGNRINSHEVELKIGDIIDLGTDIDTKFEHRKISALVEEITIIPLLNGLTPNYPSDSNHIDQMGTVDRTKIKPITVNPLSAQRAAFEAAMFGDVNNLDLEDAILGPETEILSGIFINNSIGTSPKLMNVIKLLSTELSLERQEYEKLRSMENFMINYTTNLEYINKLMIEMNDKQLIKLQDTLKKTFTEKHERILKDTMDQITAINKEKEIFKEKHLEEIKANKKLISSLEMQIEDLKTRLQVEKYKNSCLNKKKQLSSSSSSLLSSSSSSQQVVPKKEGNKMIDTSSESTLCSTKTSSNEENMGTEKNKDNLSVSSESNNKTNITKNIRSTQSNDDDTAINKDKISIQHNNNRNLDSLISKKHSNENNKANKSSNNNTSSKKTISTIIMLTTVSVGIIAVLLKQKFS